MKLKFKARNSQGELVEGSRETTDRYALARDLRSENLTLVYVEVDRDRVGDKRAWWNISFDRVKLKDKIVFTNNLGSMLGAGLALSRALSVIERQTSNRGFRKVVQSLIEKIGKGQSLSQSTAEFPKIFPEVFVAMVAAAEESGNLPNTLNILAEQMQKSYDLQRKIKGAMIYPAVIIVAIVIIAILMMIFLIPTLTATFKELGVDLPMSTRVIILISDTLSQHYLLVFPVILGLLTGVVMWLRTVMGKIFFDRFVLLLPVIGSLSRETNSAVIMRTIASLISSGVSMVQTLKITEKVVQNHFFRQAISSSAERIQKGETLSAVLATYPKLFPVFVIEMAAVGEETGKMPEMLLKGALFYEAEVDQATKNLSTIIEPILMLVIGLAVGFFAVSMIGPMYSLSNAIK